MVPAVKSMIKNGHPDKIYLLIEDDQFSEWLPDIVETINVSGQKFFKPDGPNMRSKFTYLAMMRAALSEVLPQDIDKVLSLDCDTLIVGDITELWERDLDGYYFSASIEPHRTRWNTLYTNTGVALYNLKMLRDSGKTQEVIKELNTNVYPWVEQDVFNYLCQGFILPMPSEYNANDWTESTTKVSIKHYAGISCWAGKTDVKRWRNMPWSMVL